MSPLNDFADLMDELLKRREEEGTLSQDIESDYCERLDEIWNTLTNSEQEFLEKKFGKRIVKFCG